MKLKGTGFFRELGYDLNKSLRESISGHINDNSAEIIKYLEDGVMLIVSPGFVSDVLNESKGVVGSYSIRTDGVWAWPEVLSYYVKEYQVNLSEEFIEHMKQNKWKVPEEIDLERIASDL